MENTNWYFTRSSIFYHHFFVLKNPEFELISTHKGPYTQSSFLILVSCIYLTYLKAITLLFLLFYSGYHSQAVSSNTLSSDDSTSLRSISVDLLTPDIETSSGSSAGSKMDHADETVIDLKNVTSVPQSTNINMANSTSVADLSKLKPCCWRGGH